LSAKTSVRTSPSPRPTHRADCVSDIILVLHTLLLA
jgi:hypothetical protein